jgi:hypothetical protein
MSDQLTTPPPGVVRLNFLQTGGQLIVAQDHLIRTRVPPSHVARLSVWMGFWVRHASTHMSVRRAIDVTHIVMGRPPRIREKMDIKQDWVRRKRKLWIRSASPVDWLRSVSSKEMQSQAVIDYYHGMRHGYGRSMLSL